MLQGVKTKTKNKRERIILFVFVVRERYGRGKGGNEKKKKKESPLPNDFREVCVIEDFSEFDKTVGVIVVLVFPFLSNG